MTGPGGMTFDSAQGKPAVQNVPRLIRFSGTLKDSKGAPKSGVTGVTFAIYAEQEGGAPLWMETQNVTFEEGGKYTVLLGANSSEGVPAELFTNQWRGAGGGGGGEEKQRDERQSEEPEEGEGRAGVEGAG